MKRYCLLLDLVDDPDLIREYEEYHKKIWPEVIRSMTDAGVESMEIYRYGSRMAMVMEVNETFSFSRQMQINTENETVQEWEKLMWKYQQAIPGCKPGEKWVLAEKIFSSTNFLNK
ncbi:L-rhamnose mutarotase [Membranicola marinus]|uniref:L-rhamnose mutarotase n=1 Tax=Membranihabitans marinus TaxID=1227546 RepID=A0A953LDU4_9BACT|nr:L-rhamnose mutarotase [Membranihabitans marinus]MBY5959249.1 L-rhamnose mutarotase [Membranihabitans marinus]